MLALLDKAASWLVALGRTGQWGTGRQSTDPRRMAQARKWAESGGLYLAWLDDAPAPWDTPPQPELFAAPDPSPPSYHFVAD